jgi:hypothetical protein
MILNVRSAFRWWANTEFDGGKAMSLVKFPRSDVLLMRMKFKAAWKQSLGELNEPSAPALAPFRGVDVHPIDIRAVHGEVSNDLPVASPYPNVTL